jgi:hypothetical protein
MPRVKLGKKEEIEKIKAIDEAARVTLFDDTACQTCGVAHRNHRREGVCSSCGRMLVSYRL